MTTTPTRLPTALALEQALARLGRGQLEAGAVDHLLAQVRAAFGAEALLTGPEPLVHELTVVWAVDVAAATAAEGDPVQVRVLADDNSFALPLARIGTSTVCAGAASLLSGSAFRWNYELAVGSRERRLMLPDIPRQPVVMPSGTVDLVQRLRGRGRPLEVYATHPEMRPRPGLPTGELVARLGWRSQVFAGTKRDWWYYVPAAYRADQPASVMVFQDGARPRDYVPTVFENLIARGDMPVTVGVFIEPGLLDSGESNRSFEYDTLSDQYARFLLDETLPEVERHVRLRQDPAARAISGLSSGGICSFTVAWQRPDAFRKVLSWIGSFADIRGGHNYPPLVRKSPPKPLRVFLQDGRNDLNVPAGDWWLANLEMESALRFAGYDHLTAWGNGFHSDKHGKAILPDSLRWLWRGWQE